MKSIPWLAANLPGYLRFRRALVDLETTQRALLRRTLVANAGTAFGRQHDFARIRSAEEYRQRVPLACWDDVAPWVGRIRAGESGALTRSRVRALEPTGGSAAAAKLIPYTGELQRELRRAIAPWVCDLYGRRPRLALGSAYWSITPMAGEEDGWCAERTLRDRPLAGGEEAAPGPSAVPIGFAEDAEYLGGLWRRLAEATLAVPPAVRHLHDADTFRYVTLLFLLRRRDLALVSVWHPSFLTLLLGGLPGFWGSLLADLERGTLTPPVPIAPAVQRELARRLSPLPRRAAELRRLGPEQPTLLWPRLGLVSCWGDAHAALALPELAGALPGVEIQPKGLLATEAFVTIPFAGRWPLAIRSHFFELLPEGDPGQPRFAWQLEAGAVYTVVVTTGGGLYRYRLEDRVVVEGFLGRTPSLRFLGKEGHVSDLRGEKLHEAFVAAALARAFHRLELAPRFALLAPADTPAAGYALYVEGAAETPGDLGPVVDAELAANPQYRLCRELGQLAEVTLVIVAEDASASYVDHCRKRGQRLGDIKPLALSPRSGWSPVFARR